MCNQAHVGAHLAGAPALLPWLTSAQDHLLHCSRDAEPLHLDEPEKITGGVCASTKEDSPVSGKEGLSGRSHPLAKPPGCTLPERALSAADAPLAPPGTTVHKTRTGQSGAPAARTAAQQAGAR